MAKGRKLTTSRSERFLGTYAYSHTQASAAADPSELREEDVWSTSDDTGDRDWEPHAGGSVRRRIPPDTEEHRRVGGLSLAFEEAGSGASRRIVHHQKLVANSVFEGVGRTLKGRDMSRVRDAVWNQTGFDG
uniref:Senescence regulator S40 n=1 Tax=Cajanus cajan TaxID=3821 RepID=A0A151T6V4_CAJCA|nr:hypothetical protein KK1_017331 [Cajanus cajan]